MVSSGVVLAASNVEATSIVVQRRSTIVYTMSPRTITLSSAFAMVIVMSTARLVGSDIMMLCFLVPMLHVLSVFMRVGRFMYRFRIPDNRPVVDGFKRLIFSSYAWIFGVSRGRASCTSLIAAVFTFTARVT